MDLKIKIDTNVNLREWNNKLLLSNDSTSYQTSQWCKLYQESFHSIPILISVRNSNDDVVGQLACLIHKNYYWRDSNFPKLIRKKLNLGTYIHWMYGPIIHDKENKVEIFAEILHLIDNLAIKHKVSMIRGLSPPSTNFPKKFFSELGYKLQNWSTYVTDLNQTKDNLYDLLDKKTRYDVRKALDSDFEFEIVEKKSSWLDYINLKIKSKEHDGLVVKNKPLFYDNHWNILFKSGFEKLFLARFKNEPVAGIDCFIFNNNLIQFGVVTTNKHPLAGSFLIWNVIKWAIEKKFQTFDMGGVNPNPTSEKEKKIAFFKSKWGGQKHDYLMYTKIFNKKNYIISRFLSNPKNIENKLKNLIHT